MTVIEFDDHSPLQNLSGALYFGADKIYIVGSNYKAMVKNKNCFLKLLDRCGLKAEVVYISVPKYDMNFAVDKLCEIARSDSEVIFDVSGGTDYLLAAAGIAAERCKMNGVQVQHLSVRSEKFVCFGTAKYLPKNKRRINLSCDEVIGLHGGRIVYSEDKNCGTVRWNLDKDGFSEDIEKMWEINRLDSRAWNRNSARMGELENFAHGGVVTKDVRLDVNVSKKYAASNNKSELIAELTGHLDSLAEAGLIVRYLNNSEALRFRFKNDQVRQCLLKAGNTLELITYLAAIKAKNKKGERIYNDALSGVVLDWDGKIHKGNESVRDTENEIDGLFIRGMIPVFVSCKNGGVDENELYKLAVVADKFGAKYAKKVLVATDLQKNYSSQQKFYGRAMEMNIKIIDGVHKMTFDELVRKLAAV